MSLTCLSVSPKEGLGPGRSWAFPLQEPDRLMREGASPKGENCHQSWGWTSLWGFIHSRQAASEVRETRQPWLVAEEVSGLLVYMPEALGLPLSSASFLILASTQPSVYSQPLAVSGLWTREVAAPRAPCQVGTQGEAQTVTL